MIGFGECHGHIFMDGEDYQRARARHTGGVDEAWVRRVLASYQCAGIRFYRDGGDRFGVSELAARLAPAYDMDVRTPAFAIHAAGHYGGIVGRAFSTPGEYRALVREAKSRGADFIKIMCAGILDFQNGALTEVSPDADTIRGMIREAHDSGFAVMAHVNGPAAIMACVAAGVDSVEHGYFIDEACLDAMAREGTVWVPTVATSMNLIGCGRYPDEAVKRVGAAHMKAIGLAFEKGVLVAAGSDAGAYRVPHVQGIQDEAAYLLRAAACRGGQSDEEAGAMARRRKAREEQTAARIRAAEAQIRERFRPH